MTYRFVHAVLEIANGAADTATELRQLVRPENEDDDEQDDEQFR